MTTTLPRCPTCGSLLAIRADEDPYIDRYGNDDPSEWVDRKSPWLGLLSFLSWLAFYLLPWIKRHRWCPRCRRTVN